MLSGQREFRTVLILCCLTSMGLVSIPLWQWQENLQLTFQAAASRRAQAQIFFNTGRGFTEAESVRVYLDSASLTDFRTLHVSLPARPVQEVRLDPAETEGTFLVRDFSLSAPSIGSREPLRLVSVVPFHEIARIQQEGQTLRIVTAPAATDPGVKFQFSDPIRTVRTLQLQKTWRLLSGNAGLVLLYLLIWLLRRHILALLVKVKSARGSWHAPFRTVAAKLSDANFIHFDGFSLLVYAACVLCFIAAVAANLNGSSSEMMHQMFKRAGPATTLLGEARANRSDEWGYATPDILNQVFRTDRFEVFNSDLGGHSVALLGNLPVKHVITLLRPQFWGFFLLPPEYGYAFYWQSKALLLVAGVFTWLLWLSGSSKWGLTGALWFLLSPSTQWSYSWPSGLPEMIGLSCVASVAFAYLVVGKNKIALVTAAVVAIVSSVDFAMCSYLPQMIPLAWIQIAVFIAWCWSMRVPILDPVFRQRRLVALSGTLCTLGIFGAIVFLDVHVATAAISHTVYPGLRQLSGGSLSALEFVAQLLPWEQSEHRFPALLGNLSEGAGFLWLAPFTLLCLGHVSFSRRRRAVFVALWACFLGILAWLILPIPERVGALFALNRTFGGRCVPALGLANIGIVSVCLAHHRFDVSRRVRTWIFRLVLASAGTALFLWGFTAANETLGHFFSRTEMLESSVFLAVAITLMVTSRHLVLALALIGSQAFYFGLVNPVQQGLHVFTQSELFRFVHRDPAMTRDPWLVYTNQPTLSGLFAGVGCEIYTGTRYVPDIDHFALFAARGLNTDDLNRLGYLIVTLPEAKRKMSLHLLNPVVVEWQVSPGDPLLRQIGIRYVAFDAASEPPPEGIESRLIRLADHPVDGFWLYRLP